MDPLEGHAAQNHPPDHQEPEHRFRQDSDTTMSRGQVTHLLAMPHGQQPRGQVVSTLAVLDDAIQRLRVLLDNFA